MKIDIFYVIILLATGAGVGFLSGLLGIGGGFIMVPVQYWLLTSIGIDPTIAIRVSLATSIAVILPTAVSGVYGHYNKKAVMIKATAYLSITGMAGGIIGATIASNIPGYILTSIFGISALIAAICMILNRDEESYKKHRDNSMYYAIGGLFAGLMSGLLGVGGGFIMVPFMVLLMHYDIHKAIGTSTAVIIFTSIGGVISYIINGIGTSGLPPYSLGYINLPQFIILAGASIPMAQLGVKAAHNLTSKKLSYIFIFMLIYIGLKMVGAL